MVVSKVLITNSPSLCLSLTYNPPSPLCIIPLLQVERKAAGEKVSMFRELLRITQTDQVLKRYHLDTPTYLEMSRRGASLLLTLYSDLPVAKSSPSMSHC